MRPGLVDEVRAILAANPDASIETVRNQVHARRSDVVSALRVVRGRRDTPAALGTPVPGRSRPIPEETTDMKPNPGEEDIADDAAIPKRLAALGRDLDAVAIELLQIMAELRNSDVFRAADDVAFKLIVEALGFSRTFGDKLTDAAKFYASWALAHRREGQVDREFFEEWFESNRDRLPNLPTLTEWAESDLDTVSRGESPRPDPVPSELPPQLPQTEFTVPSAPRVLPEPEREMPLPSVEPEDEETRQARIEALLGGSPSS